jgi:molybdenum cofactor cytidylyltransferase
MDTIGLVLLAAGASTRMGQVKQLLPYGRSTLLQHAVETAGALGLPTVVVTGAHAQQIRPLFSEIPGNIHLAYNSSWPEGMASSVRCGLNTLLERQPATEAAIFMVCDQPHVTAELLQSLVNKQAETGKHIVACAYQDTTGVPALFSRKFFPALLQLRGREGAKKILQQQAAEVAAVPFPMGVVDIDTPGDYDALQGNAARGQ